MIDNILGTTFDAPVIEQINARQTIMGSQSRTPNQIEFQNTNAWIRMVSSVDINIDNSAEVEEDRKADYKKAVNNLTARFQVASGPEMAKKMVLAGGIAKFDGKMVENAGGFLGVEGAENIWNGGSYGFGGLDFGYKPVPHIESAEIKYLNDGALAQATVNIKCYSPRQLDMIEVMYLRVGYTALIEWGHTNYINNNVGTVSVFDESIASKPFRTMFKTGAKTQTLYDAIKEERTKSSYNYDGFYGLVTNFNYTFNVDASYTISIQLITIGSVVEGLKANKASSKQNTNSDGTNTNPTSFLEEALTAIFSKMKSSSLTTVTNVAPYILRPKDNPLVVDWLKTQDHIVGTIAQPLDFYMLSIGVATDESTTSSGQCYISFGALMKGFQENLNLFDDKGEGIVRFEHKNNMMFSMPGHISADPTVCVLPTSTLVFTETLQSQYVSELTKMTVVESIFSSAFNLTETEKQNQQLTNNASNYLKHLDAVGINIDCIIKIANQNVDTSGKISIISFLETLLLEIKLATGSINSFQILIDETENRLYVADRHTHVATKSTNLAYFASYGIGTGNADATFLRNISFQTSLTNNFANLAAIGAQVNANQLSENATALSELNFGLIDRINPKKGTIQKSSEAADEKVARFEAAQKLSTTVNKLLEEIYVPSTSVTPTITLAKIQELKIKLAEHLQFLIGADTNKKNIPSPFFIPFELSLEMMGLSGMKILQRFTVDDYILPFSYRNKVSFIVFDIVHSIQQNKWTTKLRSYTAPIVQDAVTKVASKVVGTTQTPRSSIPSITRSVGNVVYKTKYPEFPILSQPIPTFLTFTEAVRYLKKTTTDSTGKAVFAVIYNEATKVNGTEFRSPGAHNYAGVQTDSGRWSAKGISGQYGVIDNVQSDGRGGTVGGNPRTFAMFVNNTVFLNFMIETLTLRKFDGNNSTTWASSYLNRWVYSYLEKQDKVLFDKLLPGKKAIYNDAMKVWNKIK